MFSTLFFSASMVQAQSQPASLAKALRDGARPTSNKVLILDLPDAGAAESASLTGSQPHWASKVDLGLLLAYRSAERQDLDGLRRHAKDASGRPKVFLTTHGPADLSGAPGFEVLSSSPSGRIHIGRLTPTRLPELASLSEVRSIESPGRRHIQHENSRVVIGVDRIHAGEDLPMAYRGEGTVVGVLDSGIDFDHPDFTVDGETRLQYLAEWVQGEDELKVWSKQQIDSDPSQVTQIDGIGGGGHGTHVAGTAAGGGVASPEFTGMAPASDLMFVKGIRDEQSSGGFDDPDVALGVEFIFTKAEELGQPAVVNLSLGGLAGPLDGTSAFERYLTELTGPGRIITAAAGNSGMDYVHAGTDLTAGETAAHWAMANDPAQAYATLWYAPDAVASYSVAAVGFDEDLTPYTVAQTPWFDVGTTNYEDGYGESLSGTINEQEVQAGYVYHNSTNTEDPDNGDGLIEIEIHNGEWGDGIPTSSLDQFVWVFMVRASDAGGRMDAFHGQGSLFSYEIAPLEGVRFIPGDRTHSVGSPSTAERVISVGAFVSTVDGTDQDGNPFTLEYPEDLFSDTYYVPEVGDAAYFTSIGPTRDGRMNPVVSAPGDLIFSARSFDIADADLDMYMKVDGAYVGMQGTSMATPHVTGVVALLLQINPELDYDDLVGLFERTSVLDEKTGSEPGNVFGYGRLDAYAAVKSILTATTAERAHELPERVSLLGNYPNPFNPSTTIPFTLRESGQVLLEIYNTIGQQVAVLHRGRLAAGYHELRFDAAGLPSGLYIARLEASGVVRTQPMMLVK